MMLNKNVVTIYLLKEPPRSPQKLYNQCAVPAVTPPTQLGAVAICHAINFHNTFS